MCVANNDALMHVRDVRLKYFSNHTSHDATHNLNLVNFSKLLTCATKTILRINYVNKMTVAVMLFSL